ncbi:hypothetical protein SLS62_004292 [Diatrype stigma]|uniref:Uncharacterized protein n=1 Tax=Diatrype stigma TaxID=117547 RepID=A0AAN9UWR6_9PEZI
MTQTRIGVGLGLLAWGFVGLQLSDRAEERFGLQASDEDREALARLGPRIIPVDPAERGSGGGGGGDGR